MSNVTIRTSDFTIGMSCCTTRMCQVCMATSSVTSPFVRVISLFEYAMICLGHLTVRVSHFTIGVSHDTTRVNHVTSLRKSIPHGLAEVV